MLHSKLFWNHNSSKNQIIYHYFKHYDTRLRAIIMKMNFIIFCKLMAKKSIKIFRTHSQKSLIDRKTVLLVKNNWSVTINLVSHRLKKVDVFILRQVYHRRSQKVALLWNNRQELLRFAKKLLEKLHLFLTLILSQWDLETLRQPQVAAIEILLSIASVKIR